MAKPLRELYDDLQLADAPGRTRARSAGHDDPFISKLLHLVLSHGVQVKASDIHLEPTAAGARIRYRIDGILHEMLQLSTETSEPLTRAIKVKANLTNDTIGRSKPQDSRIDFELPDHHIDLRLSTFPTLFGDVLAVRILVRSAPLLDLEQVGFPPSMLEEFERLIRRPNGLLLVTGPSGSGKTTTLYAGLNTLRAPHIKIVTLEDPVEYQVDGIDQGQINPAVGLTFASGLRAILRQDANVILVGEIRDKETAEIAIRAALTGHLVFSTMHTRHSVGAASRLIDMGIEPHLILASLNGVMAQRLVRLVCQTCREPDAPAGKPFAALWQRETGAAPPESHLRQLTRGRGCAECNGTGYRGRTAIFELLILDEELKRLILESATAELYRKAVASGRFRTMLCRGLEKASAGLTTLEEVLRVTGESQEC